jgi:hypothetical protein
MTTRVIVGDLRTGRRLFNVPYTGAPWSNFLNDPGSLQINIPMFDKRAQDLKLNENADVNKTFMAILENDVFMQYGPVFDHDYDHDSQTLKLTGVNILGYLSRRLALPANADSKPLILPNGKPDPTMNLQFTGRSMGTIVADLLKVINSHTGAQLPFVYQAAQAGTNTEAFVAADLKSVGEFIQQYAERENGPDVVFRPRWREDRLGVELFVETGTNEDRRVYQKARPRWDFAVKNKSVRGLKVRKSGADMGSTVYTTGGRSDDKTLIDRQVSKNMVESGYPKLDIVDSSHSSVVRAETLRKHGVETLRKSDRPTVFWEFEVRKDRGVNVAGDYLVGDYCTVVIRKDPYLGTGTFTRRIVGMSGDAADNWIKITTGEVLADG